MKINPIRLLFAAVAAAVLFCQSAVAQVVTYTNGTSYLTEEFQYSTSGQLGATGAGGGSTPPAAWNTPQPNFWFTNTSHSLDGTSLGLVQSYGGSVMSLGLSNGTTTVSGAGLIIPNGCYNKFFQSGGTISSTNVSGATTNLYTSFLLNFKTTAGITNGSFITAMNLQSGGIQSASGADSYWQVLAKTNSGKVQLGIAKNVFNNTGIGGAGVTNWDNVTLLTPGQTYFVVVRLSLNVTNASNVGGSYSTNCEDDLWINPPAYTFYTNEANVPAPDVSSPVGDGTIPSSPTGPGRLFLVDSYAQYTIDEIRIASSWALVTPPAGQCLSAQVLVDPTNVTQSAEIPAIISTSYIGTGATNTWLLSKDGGVTWTTVPNIPPGADTSSTLITGNLQYPADNGNIYRCVVGVPCDSSSDTSLWAHVTLTPTTPTSPGVIMNDPFTGQVFNYPVTPVNSVWFSLTDASGNPYFTDYPGPGATATTITNSSTLYVGYFVDQNAAPVDLPIGSSIQVTLPFTPNDFSQFSGTGNGPLRFGLYDYRDLGVPIAASSTTLTGSAGQAYGVMGYMLDLNFGTNFTDTTPLNLYVRNNLTSPALASSTGDYYNMTGGPVGGVNTNTIVFQSGVSNTLIFTVTRTGTNSCVLAATITNAIGLNVTFSAGDTNNLGWHRFDSFAIRPNSGFTTAYPSFFIPSFNVQVIGGVQVVPTSITITNMSRATNSVVLGWQALPSGGTYSYSVLSATNIAGPWNVNAGGLTANTYTDNNTLTNNIKLFYRVSSP
jgi:hypothetical protein